MDQDCAVDISFWTCPCDLFCWWWARNKLILCVLDRQSPCSRTKGGAGGGWGVAQLGLITQRNCIFMIFVYWLWTWRLSALQDFCVICFCCESMHRSKVHSSSDNHTQITQIHALVRAYVAYRGACPPLQPLPAARTHIVSHRHPYLIAADWPPGSRACSETFSLFPFSALVVWNSILTLSIYESLYLSFCVSIYWSVFLCVSSPLPLSQTSSPQGEREGKRQLWLRARSQNLLHLDFITNKPAHGWRIIIKGKKIKEKGGSKACNMVNKFKLSIKKKALILFLCPKPNGNQLLLS